MLASDIDAREQPSGTFKDLRNTSNSMRFKWYSECILKQNKRVKISTKT